MLQNDSLTGSSVLSKENIIDDYRLACESRQVSLLGRKDTMGGRSKFGIFGDGKEVAQIALSKVFQPGDFRSGYYRDQTIEAAVGNLTWQQFFAQMYAHADLEHEPNTGGRSMNGHFSTRWIDENGDWLDQTKLYNSVCDISSTAGQIPRSVGLGYASKLYRENTDLHDMTTFSHDGNEVVFATIGDASTSQGMFWEAMNAAGVLQIPLIVSVWDDGYGISVPVEYQTTKSSISKALAGLQRNEDGDGIEILVVNGWDYPALVEAYQKAAKISREQHVPVLVHVTELTQPQGHSTSGSHERYKSKQRLAWEREHDCNVRFRDWILKNGYATDEELEQIEAEAKEKALGERNEAWQAYRRELDKEYTETIRLLQDVAKASTSTAEINNAILELQKTYLPVRRDMIATVRKVLRLVGREENAEKLALQAFLRDNLNANKERFNTHLYSETRYSPMLVEPVSPVYSENSPVVDGREVIRTYFDALFEKDPRVVALGEDIGFIGDVNQGFAGLQEKYGEIRITDTGIRETTIIGQGIGMAMRGLRPIVEIQYFDYIYYALATLTDDLASLRYRTAGGQRAPLIIRTRGHRLEGIWHSGSPMGTMLSSLRGLHVVVPRNFTQAAGFYNTLMKGDDPALIVEPLNSYRQKETMPDNVGDYYIPLGQPEILREGNDLTIVTYGSMCRIVMEAASQLQSSGIEVEVIDVQTLLPFDVDNRIVESIKKTNRVIFADEDLPGSASGFMMQQVLERQQAYRWLDSAPVTIAAKDHRPPYGSDGDYFSKPNMDDIFETVYNIMREAAPDKYPELFNV
ncbi:pyruvate/2-oxoglutarate/acetoin dehydrogenase E1 component/TPP-dependent pyruvate/acetoin dehydrogenase alpha subunit [Dyadobacter sp. BE34]|uniref:Pyruvate/2-oxoglutarate/acetoin dehydrogenase E1 component/TPP-dependent pyruvate/acetoin dehydrogenase alpha subunit n=1 Tax=Dyadobacter fermentans TaxID=94254 RepID=A0ABU1R311_9BACT|nr:MULTISPECIES: thiamine pyrophosphate-dependent enzyme [Dyadobacter]MDR6807814.1 pyruvate/2-oxoglutarate/acetoin dehydrogenase E1 component/TPP-dependent pyruvate/acetoin dehydrogenase alpha subunit [Dyadobacter fermentans]MDR7045555.1 pyruvate/2-oxoglutarate/acetoin dehydrogenase E1 component/TPP-dependent pyruvate/acetoin dehydrogenase alpha subunit [Dyadobacter sp. BE242]MDR7199868.1 pyruvate/2-oxoglutarate/acetoin dehydrogenase E1 component/TPP-dependent pyruvate/acetoin dehydrogenase alph